MKKPLLLALGLLPALAFAQIQGESNFVQPSPEQNQAVPVEKKVLTEMSPMMNPNNPAFYAAKKGKTDGVDFIQVGRTFYDLQTNASSGRRVYLHNDGTVSLTWTTDPEGKSGFALRGAGYNYHNGTDFIRAGEGNGSRVDNFRSGWPSIGILPNGQEWIIAHDATNGGFRMSKNDSKGSENWTTGPAILQWPDGQRPIWNRAANNGNTLHLICNFADSSAPGDPRVISRNGVRGPMMYSRSKDAGVTWDKENTMLPGYDSTRILGGGGDNYAIDVNGNTVAIVTGGLADDVILWKSTDDGETFTRIIVDSFPYAPFDGLKFALDTPQTNDGSVDVLIDNNGDCHVFWGVSRVFDDDTTDASFNFFPATALLAGWSESTGVTQGIGGVVDENGNGTLDIEPGTWSSLQSGQVPSGLGNVARMGNTGLVNMPSAGIDAQGRIFVTYSAPRENDLSIDNVNCRDIYIVYSTDGGATWSDPQNITQVQLKEDAFPAIARRVDDFVHVLWQQDETPGTNLQNNATGGNNQPVVENAIMYAAVPVSKIINDEIGQGPGVGLERVKRGDAEIFRVSQNFPNPFSNETNVTVYLTEMTDVTLTVTNLLGQTVISQNLGTFNAGNSTITIDANGLSSGVYTYTLSTGTYSVGNKMIVK